MRQNTQSKIIDDRYEFFRRATLCLCRHLEIESAMCDCAGYIQGFIPVDTMFLQIYEPRLGAMRTVASATGEEGVTIDLLTPLPEVAWAYVQEREETAETDRSIIIFNRPGSNPLAHAMLRSHDITSSSMMRMSLTTESGRLAGVVLTAQGEERYTEDHAHLFSLIREPFAIAIENTYAFRTERLKEKNTGYLEGGSTETSREHRKLEVAHFPTLDEVVADHIRKALDLAGGKVHGRQGAGAILGVNPNTLRYRMRKLGIPHGRQAKRA